MRLPAVADHNNPNVSIMLPCLNEAETLPACIRNASEALAAIAGELGLRGEIIVADNGSTDGSREIAQRLGVRVIPVAQRGYGCALRAGCAAAFGRFIVVGDSDEAALALARRAYRRWHDSFTFLSSGRNYTLVHPRPPHFDAIAEDGRGIAGSPATVLAALRKQVAETGANYIVGQFAFGDMTTEETLASLELFTRQVMPALRG